MVWGVAAIFSQRGAIIESLFLYFVNLPEIWILSPTTNCFVSHDWLNQVSSKGWVPSLKIAFVKTFLDLVKMFLIDQISPCKVTTSPIWASTAGLILEK